MKFTLEAPVPVVPVETPVSITLKQESDGAVLMVVQKGEVRADLLRITNDGRLAFISCQEDKLKKLGFQTGRDWLFNTIKIVT